jgi:hypothetical protein
LRTDSSRRLVRPLGALALLALALLGARSAPLSTPAPPQQQAVSAASAAPPRWWKGNTHTHTLWSDGDAAPEVVADWYRSHGYHFLVLSDHNVLSQGERWFPLAAEGGKGDLTQARVDELRARFGDDAVVVRAGERGPKMRLVTLDELRARFERPGEFLFVQGEEVSATFGQFPVHVNGLNLAEPVAPVRGSSLRETLQLNIDAILEQGRRLERAVLAHVNHPNFYWALSAEDLASIEGERFFEVYNGHSAVRNYGDAEHPGTEAMWDLALTLRLHELGLPVLYGMATDDAHQYFKWRTGKDNPGRGWVMVRARELTAEALIAALRAGDFYATSGVLLESIEQDERRLRIAIAAEDGLEYTTTFVGTRRRGDALGPPGEPLHEARGRVAEYAFQGDELYVRAVVVSSRAHPNPYAEGDRETAWVQPVVP